jgi:hypothetical protein
MRYTYAISALRYKRARLVGEIEAAERAIAKQRETLATLDATLRLFHPEADPSHITAVRPVWRGIYFRHGERPRLCLEALRDAGSPLHAPRIAEYLMRAKGLDVNDRPLRAAIVNFMASALGRLARKGLVRKIIAEPEVWWELVQNPLTDP